jgi:hypothetical protein
MMELLDSLDPGKDQGALLGKGHHGKLAIAMCRLRDRWRCLTVTNLFRKSQ